MKVNLNEFNKSAKLIRNMDIYNVYDITYLDSLVLSMTVLHPGKETTGHLHSDAEEVYIFMDGNGKMQLGEDIFHVSKDDAVLIAKSKFHKVFNNTDKELVYITVFEKYSGRGDKN